MVERDEVDLTARMRAGTSGIHARSDALGVVREHVGRRVRRRRIRASAAALAVAVVGSGAALAVGLRGDGGSTVRPTDDATEVGVAVDGSDPAAFFVSLVGGRAQAQQMSYREAPGEKARSRFLWWPGDGTGRHPVFAASALERYDGTPQARCEALAAASPDAACTRTGRGLVVLLVDAAAGDTFTDPLNRIETLADPVGSTQRPGSDADDRVRRATVLRDDGWAVSLTLCACGPSGPDLADVPLAGTALADAAGDDRWVERG